MEGGILREPLRIAPPKLLEGTAKSLLKRGCACVTLRFKLFITETRFKLSAQDLLVGLAHFSHDFPYPRQAHGLFLFLGSIGGGGMVLRLIVGVQGRGRVALAPDVAACFDAHIREA